jgi:hypothetical protein
MDLHGVTAETAVAEAGEARAVALQRGAWERLGKATTAAVVVQSTHLISQVMEVVLDRASTAIKAVLAEQPLTTAVAAVGLMVTTVDQLVPPV